MFLPTLAAAPEYGEAVGGLRVAVEILPTDWRPNAHVEFACTVENTGPQSIRTAAWGLDLTQAIEIRDAGGKIIAPEAERRAAARIPRGAILTLAPGESRRFVLRGRITAQKALVVKELLGGTWTWPLAEGSLSVRAVFEKGAADAWAKPLLAGGYWTGKALSPAMRVVMSGVALDPGEAVNGLKLKLSAENTDLGMTPAPRPDGASGSQGNGAGGWKVTPAKIEISFINDGDAPLAVNARDLLAGLVRFEIDGPDDDSVRVTRGDVPAAAPLRRPEPAERVERADIVQLEPDSGWTTQTPVAFPGRLGGVTYELLKPGEYRVSAVYTSGRRDCWTGLVQSNVLVFTVMGGPSPAGAPVKGLKLELSADPKEILIDGDPAKLTVTFTNADDLSTPLGAGAPVKLNVYDLIWSRLKIEVTGPDGRPLAPFAISKAKREMAAPTEGDYPTLAPGASWSEKARPRFPGSFGNAEFRITRPGEYRLKVTYESKPLPMDGEFHPFAKGCWTGVVTSNEISINVIGALKPAR